MDDDGSVRVTDALTLMTLPPFAWLRWASDWMDKSRTRWHPACILHVLETNTNSGGVRDSQIMRDLINSDGLLLCEPDRRTICCYTACRLMENDDG